MIFRTYIMFVVIAIAFSPLAMTAQAGGGPGKQTTTEKPTASPTGQTVSQAGNASTVEASGTVIGRITDQKTNAAIANASIQVTGTRIGTMTDDNGKFTLRGVPAGTVGLTIRRIGYAPTTVKSVVIHADSTVTQNVQLASAAVELQSQEITAAVSRGGVADALEARKEAPAIVNAITSEEIAKSPDGDAAQAVQRVTGVTVQDGKYVFVRGLGERYTTTSLNGARIPSPEPERRVVPLDLFPTGLIQGIVTAKTFTPDKPGDFGGATVDIQMKEFPLKRQISYSFSTGFNSLTSGRTLLASPRAGGEWFAFATGNRALSNIVKHVATSDTASRATINSAIRSLRNDWTPITRQLAPNYSFGANIGGVMHPFGQRVGYMLSGSYGNSNEAKSNEVRSLAVMNDQATGEITPFSRFAGRSSTASVLWGGLFNASTLIGERTRLITNNMYNRSGDNEATELFGNRDQDDNVPTLRRSIRYIERSVRSNQLRAEHMFSERNAINFGVTLAGVSRNEPDRTELDYVREVDIATNNLMPYMLFIRNMDGARKTFATLEENSVNLNADYNFRQFKVGALYRNTRRTADNYAFSVVNNYAPNISIPQSLLEMTAENIFSGGAVSDTSSYFIILRNSFGGTYSAKEAVTSTYGMITQEFGRKLKLIGGVRAEHVDLTVTSLSTTRESNIAKRNNWDILPALNLQYNLNPDQNLRLGLSQTVSRPEYREISPVEYRDMVEQRTISGNSNLQQSRITNVDLRWEWYPSSLELISVGVFGKHFTAPIERVEIATSGASRLGYINADNGYNLGIEMEFRRSLNILSEKLEPLTLFSNLTLMKSEINMESNEVSSFTHDKRPMIGQAPYVLNTGINYVNAERKISAALLYNVVGKRLQAGGIEPLPDTYELQRHMVDMSLQVPLFQRIQAKMDIKNLLDSPYKVEQGGVLRAGYKTGRSMSLGFRWEP